MDGSPSKLELHLADPKLKEKYYEWLKWDRNPTTSAYIEQLARESKVDELGSRLLQRLSFGTAGLRGSMGAGFNHLNDLVIIETTQGLAKYLLKTIADIKDTGVVIGFDNRHNSLRFSQLAATVLLSQNIPVHLFSRICPTPFVPFSLLQLGCRCGVMVTASHNPKQDNGYKVYWENGAQILSPHDKGIAAAIEENLVPWSGSWDVVTTHPLLHDPLPLMMSKYMDSLSHLSHYSDLNAKHSAKFVYTPMHGVGLDYVMEAVKAFKLAPFIPVDEQKNPDPEFPTVEYPNPEEGKRSLDLAVATAEKHKVRIILANDPDADRFAMAEKVPNGTWRIFSGNDIGTLLGWWMWHCHCKCNPNNFNAKDCYMIASTVSSKMLRSMATVEGFNFEETLTGFKWIANRADGLKKAGKRMLFAFEEAIGFMCGDMVMDKDGISACMVAAEMIGWLVSQKLSVVEHLEYLHKKYGHHVSENSYFMCHHPPSITSIFERLRNYEGPHTYPKSCGRFQVASVRDLTVGVDSSQPDNKPILPVSKGGQMITFTFKEGIVATLRTSGTEPKLKYYTEIAGQPGTGTRDLYEKQLHELVKSLVAEFLQPEINKIRPKAE